MEKQVRFGTADLEPDPWRPSAWLVSVDGVLQSYVDLDDPTYLRMPFTVWMAQVIERHWPAGAAISAVHVGGGGLTLPRYLAADRPGSEQTVFELDGPLVDLVREHLGLDAVPGVRVEVRDGRAGVEGMPDDSADLVVVDVFRGGDVATELATVEFVRQIGRVLRPGGLYATNLWDGGDLGFALRAVAAIGEVFPHVLVFGETGVLIKLRPGNLVVVASSRELPVAELAAWAKDYPSSVNCLTPPQFADTCGTAPPLTEADPQVRLVPSVRPWRRD
ncbi:MAG TPA: fused MFS/spermidine synthase [Actinophytocola sp.]|uniref:spermidine synthase n=1 Tax=Actinophytocola sp. TaxID=1872138 RepID=UPI002DDD014A|nr:fused MFS/spermidine synthase [Actinophytocola sp.]HEV2783470.1 fused MFS/spermidine synthase [Actinophytocola sp.]